MDLSIFLYAALNNVQLLYNFRGVTCLSELILKPLYEIKAHRAGYQAIIV